MSILLNAESRIMVQGITGKRGRFHSERMLLGGSPIVGGTSPGKGGDWVFSGRVPVFDTVKECVDSTNADTSVIFVPPHATADAILESIDAGIKNIISITGSVPLQDMMRVKSALKNSASTLIGPNSPGVLIPGIANAGIFPDDLSAPGNIAIVSRYGTLAYELMSILKEQEIGLSAIIGIGDEPVSGIDFQTCLEFLEADPHTEKIILIGGPGGESEIKAATFIMEHVTKPVVAYVVGENLAVSIMRPFFARNGGIYLDTIGKKANAFIDAGVLLAATLEEIPNLLKR